MQVQWYAQDNTFLSQHYAQKHPKYNNKHVYPTALRDGPTNNCFHHSIHLYKEQIILNAVYAPTTEFYFPHT